MAYFEDILVAINDDPYIHLSDEGLASMYEIFKYLAEGGDITSHPQFSDEDITTWLAYAFITCRDMELAIKMVEGFEDGPA